MEGRRSEASDTKLMEMPCELVRRVQRRINDGLALPKARFPEIQRL